MKNSLVEARGAQRPAASEDQRMWRRLLAQLHPDAGGDGDLFAFACALREETGGWRWSGQKPPEPPREGDGQERKPAAPFLQTWQHTMDLWATSNRDALKRF